MTETRQRLFYSFPWKPPHSESPAHLSPLLLSQGKSEAMALLKSFRSHFSKQDFCSETALRRAAQDNYQQNKPLPGYLMDPFISEQRLFYFFFSLPAHLFMKNLQSCRSTQLPACIYTLEYQKLNNWTQDAQTVLTEEHLASKLVWAARTAVAQCCWAPLPF